ncbi:MAG: polyprenyl synthetase family protein [Gammaproteobacteria bacterium]|nr:polyprenyl synthetase family protein [Gammaproteobacteria bacterium]MBU1647109.1 polyprenyl synthetase family protein [Gammaproteobacteria bacterium]MBU1972621.1 polyprenyl synthetase family protein [Gammaproteobacteria bacterium]
MATAAGTSQPDFMNFADWMSAVQDRTEAALATYLPPADTLPARLHDAMRYAALGGGKRVRPLLCHAAGAVFDASSDELDRAACAVELIHAYSLVHDDMPCMDNDTLRRGKPTVHVEYDEAIALMVGDALQSLAFQVLAETPAAPSRHSRLSSMIALLAHAAGSRGMAGGQAIDLAAVGRTLTLAELEQMHIHKTGALIRAAVLLGGHCGEADDAALANLTHFANRIGLLFQVIDDILDAEASTATLGKTAGKDAAQNKPTYVSLLGVSRAKELAAELRDNALAALASFGARGERLAGLTRYIVERDF